MDDDGKPAEKNFCVWTSMLQRSVSTAQYFDDEEYDIKEMRMLNELNAGVAEGLTYDPPYLSQATFRAELNTASCGATLFLSQRNLKIFNFLPEHSFF